MKQFIRDDMSERLGRIAQQLRTTDPGADELASMGRRLCEMARLLHTASGVAQGIRIAREGEAITAPCGALKGHVVRGVAGEPITMVKP